MNIFYKDPQIASQVYKSNSPTNAVSNLVSKVNTETVSAVTNKTINTIKQNVESKEPAANINKVLSKNSFIQNNIMAICAVCLIVLLVLPFANFSAETTADNMKVAINGIDVSGFETIFGIKEIKMGSNRSIFALFLLVIPVLIIAMNYIKRLNPLKKWIAVGAPMLGILTEIGVLLDIKELCKTFIIEDGVELKTSLGIGFFLILIFYIVTAIIGFSICHNKKLHTQKKE